MTDPLATLFDPVLQDLSHRVGLEAACKGVARLLNAAAVDGLTGHPTHGDRLLDEVAGRDAPPDLRRKLAAMVAGRRRLWPLDRRVLREWSIEDAKGGVMLRTRCDELDVRGAADLVVELLVEVPPASVGELRARLSGLRRPSIRAALRRALEAGDLHDDLVEIVVAAFEAVDGPGRQLRPLARIASNEQLPPQRREAAWRVIIGCPEAEVRAVISQVDPVHQQELTGLGLGAMLRRVGGSSRAAELLRSQLTELALDARREILQGVETVRRLEGIPAAALYGGLVATRTVPELDDLVVPELVADGGPAAEQALVHALQSEQDPTRERLLRRGLLDLRTARIEPSDGGEASTCSAWVGLCDGQAAFPVLVASRNERGRFRLASVVVRCRGEVRDGFVADDLDARGLEDLVERYSGVAELVPIDPAVAAAWVADGMASTEGGLDGLPPEIARAVDEILRRARHGIGLPERRRPAPRLRLADCRQLFLRPTLRSWFLDEADLAACGIPAPPEAVPDVQAWSRRHASSGLDARVRERLTAMADHLARCLASRGALPESAVAARVVTELEAGGGEVFFQAVLEQTALVHQPAPQVPRPQALRFGDEALREDLRRFLQPRVPRARDLATLDLLDLLLSCDQDVFGVHVESARVRPDVRRAALRAAGTTLTELVAEGRMEDIRERLHTTLYAAGVPAPAVEPVCASVLALTRRFLEEVCQQCPVQCFNDPDAPAGRAWHGPGHPAFTG